MSQDTPETILIPKAELLRAVLQASVDGQYLERQSIKQRLIDLRAITPAGSAASLELSKWIRELD